MKINSIDINNFRNFENIFLNFDETNIIYGENAQGKTNLIEAIYLFSGAKSFRGVKDKELIKFGEKRASLFINFENSNREQTAKIIIENSKEIYLNEIKKKSPIMLSDEIKTIIFSPSNLSMIQDGPSERRHFIDAALCSVKSNYQNILKEYKRCLVQRNMLLKDIAYHPEMSDMLSIWDKNLSKIGAKIIYQRQKYIDALYPFANEIHSGLSSEKEKLSMSINTDFQTKDKTLEKIENDFCTVLKNNKSEDVFNKITMHGPHRDDIDIFINDISARKFASQGQQRSTVLSLKLAQAQLLKELTEIEPIILLDDVLSELDEKRQDYILNNMKNRQIFITCCDKNSVLRLKNGKSFNIVGGKCVNS